ncbi:MAG: leucine-rich repeat domain-containing protein, partial [Lachnospiraceae bacterium]|nr:leucine-rich repeat domain-containing protein [Lachnospiraceae bacterium]
MGLKLKSKMKKRIRKAVAGVCLVSSVLVAAIPADYSGVAQADSPNPMEAMDYSIDSGLARNGDLESKATNIPSLTPPASAKIVNSYNIQYISNAWNLDWQYTYFTEGSGDSKIGVITGYNNRYAVDKLDLSSTIASGYQIVELSEFNAAMETVSYTLDKSPYSNDSAYGRTLDDVKEYFPTYYNRFKNDYDAAVTRYCEEHDCGADEAYGLSFNALGVTAMELNKNDMDEADRLRYYCDKVLGLKGFTLELVNNSVPGATYVPDFDGVNTAEIPQATSVYIPRLINMDDKGSLPTNLIVDDNGFRITARQLISAIGEKAFYGCNGVNEILVGNGIAYIGDSAFEDSFIITVAFDSVTYIGNRVFKNSKNLTGIALASDTTIIGKEAFYGCPQLTKIEFTDKVEQIGFGAFANCQNLREVDLSTCTKVNIGEYAFFDCPSLADVTFAPPQSTTSIGKAAFALSTNGSHSVMNEFTFPELIETYASAANNETYNDLYDLDGKQYTSPLGDYILAGRTTLKTVTMPDNLGDGSAAWVPMNTFMGCQELETVTFPDNARMASYHKDLFKDVENAQFYVRGPENISRSSTNPALPRESTWSASTNAAEYVPYVYTDVYGDDHYEVGIGDYRYELKINTTEAGVEDGTATLIACRFINSPVVIEDLIIPGTVASYRVTALGNGCFDAPTASSAAVKDYIVNLIVNDDSIEDIGEGVFEGCDLLKTVRLGNSVETIGTEAFADNKLLESVVIGERIASVGDSAFVDCPKLTEVIWETPGSYNTPVEIADNAFVTGGQNGLYFEGDIKIGYGPFDFAMEDDTVPGGQSHYINNNGTRICYRSSGPNYYYVIRDEQTDENLLIDYPHYADLPQEIRDRYERKTISENGVSVNLVPTPQDIQIVNETRQLVLPEAITSIDVKSFYLSTDVNNENQGSWIYIDALNNPDVSGVNIARRDLYSNDDLVIPGTDFEKQGGYHAGLFSGYYVDLTPLTAVESKENQIKGNDWIISIEMPGVTSIPDYAFDSCENLQGIILSDACEEIAPTAFQNCDALRTIAAAGNYTFDNYILYKILPNGTYQITTCLPGRGLIDRDAKALWVNSSNDPNLTRVSEMEIGTFEGCKEIMSIDLSETSITRVPQNAFQNCEDLATVIFPDTSDLEIGDYAFGGNASSLSLT